MLVYRCKGCSQKRNFERGFLFAPFFPNALSKAHFWGESGGALLLPRTGTECADKTMMHWWACITRLLHQKDCVLCAPSLSEAAIFMPTIWWFFTDHTHTTTDNSSWSGSSFKWDVGGELSSQGRLANHIQEMAHPVNTVTVLSVCTCQMFFGTTHFGTTINSVSEKSFFKWGYNMIILACKYCSP